jgi:hypothetical protein
MLRLIGLCAVIWFLIWSGIAQSLLLMTAAFLTFLATI